jgi:hypothetical protein
MVGGRLPLCFTHLDILPESSPGCYSMCDVECMYIARVCDKAIA